MLSQRDGEKEEDSVEQFQMSPDFTTSLVAIRSIPNNCLNPCGARQSHVTLSGS
jgi:hypothetical protein